MLDYEKDTQIDPTALDVEWLKQADLMFKYVKHASEMKQAVDDAKERVEVGKARIELQIRNNPEAFGLSKVTEGAIQSTIIMQEEYALLIKEYNETKFESDIAQGAVRAIDQKKTALENLVKLLGASYFAGPKAPRNLEEEYEAIQKAERRKTNSKVKINRKKGD